MFEIGDKIILKEEYKNTTLSERNYIPQSVVDNIADEIHTVTNVGADSISYYIEIDDNGYSWNPDMFKLVEENLVEEIDAAKSTETLQRAMKEFKLPEDKKEIERIVDELNKVRY